MNIDLQNQLAEIDVTIEQAEENINNMKMLDRLWDHKDFQELILKGYFEKEAARLVIMLANPGLTEEHHQKQIYKMMDGVSYFRQYLNRIFQIGSVSERTLAEHRQTRNELMSEV